MACGRRDWPETHPRTLASEEGLAYIAAFAANLDRQDSEASFVKMAIFVCAPGAPTRRKAAKNDVPWRRNACIRRVLIR
jgi:hypothetical protein